MLASRLSRFLTVPSTRLYPFPTLFWLTHSLTLAAIYASLALGEAFSSEYVVQDDARQHVFWMMRFLDPSLFPHDPIADYFQSVAPPGYTTLYQFFAYLGIPPLVFNKILPFLLGLLTTAYAFGVSMQLLPVPFAGFCSAAILNLSLWMRNDLVSGTPRAFVYPLFVAFLYYLLKRQKWGVWIAIALMGLFYPQYVLVEGGILGCLLLWTVAIDRKYRDVLFLGGGLAIAAASLLPYLVMGNPFDPPITVAEAREFPEFWMGGRNAFFDLNWRSFWLFGERSGLIPKRTPAILWIGLALPLLYRYSALFSLTKKLDRKIYILIPIAVSSLVLFFAAHAFLFKLHLPSRYTLHGEIICLSLLSGMTFVIVLDAILRWSFQQPRQKTSLKYRVGIWATALALGTIVLYPVSLEQFPRTSYQVGTQGDLYQFFKEQPQDILIASLEPETDNLPSFSQRSVLVAQEYSIAYHTGYYYPFRQRTIDLIRAQYSPTLEPLEQLIDRYHVDFFILNKQAFKPNYIVHNIWLNSLRTSIAAEGDELAQTIQNSLAFLQAGNTPAIAQTLGACAIYQTSSVLVLDARCMSRVAKAKPAARHP
ncbi:MAG TPA: hypothetical protein IGS17_20180 [Oscillatoriales cyanobacterium M59_W2019_021]|nr:hypothetical protein [Oscillatoriales cyanobacterium M4454_W2019_049]HIK53211.1 hypothetical protein [Oscillatoriales cyanobacterium M59_W2019_021]